MALLTMVSMGAWAQIDVQIANDGKFDGGTIKYVDQTKPDEKGFVTVTITVTPNKEKGYTIKKGDISVYSTLSPSGPSAGTRALEIADNLTLYFKGSADADTDDPSAEREYTFNVPSGFGAWVKEAEFDKKRDGAKSGENYYAIYLADKGYLKNVANEHEIDFNNFTTNSKWTFTAEGKLQCGTTYLKENGETLTTTTSADDATVWTREQDANNSAKYYFKTSDNRYMRSGWVLSSNLATGEDDRYVAYEVRGSNNNVVWLPNGTYVIMNRIIDYIRTDKNPPNLLYPNGSNKLILGKKQAEESAQWEIEVDGDGWYTFKNVSTQMYITTNGSSRENIYAKATSIDDKCRFSLMVFGTTNKYTTWDGSLDGTVCSVAPSQQNPWYYSICPYDTQSKSLNPKSDDVNKVGPADKNKPAGSQWNIIPYEIVGQMNISGQTFVSETGNYILSATGFRKLNHSENPNNSNTPLYPTDYNSGITYTWTLTTGTEYASLSGETTTDNVSTVTLNINSTPEITSSLIVHCQATHTSGITWGRDFTITIIVETAITSLSQITNPLGGYRLLNDVSDTPGVSDFKGSLNGDFHSITGLSAPLFNTLDGGEVKNVVFKEVSISNGTNVGAVCAEATGAAHIYNCGILSGSVSGTYAGGLVGHIKSGSSVRVVNCYNYANVSGSSYAAGIVGYNEGTVGDVRIALCMMYGTVSGATNISPVYAGNHTSNAQNFNEYNYYLYSTEKDDEGQKIIRIPYTAYNDQLAIDKEEYLTRFPFYRHILNTHRELASYFLFGDYAESHVDEIGHWVVKKEDNAPKYPVVEQWAKNTTTTPTQTNNNLPNTTEDYAGKLLTTLGTSGYLSVSIKIGSNSYTESLPITDMDTLRYDYTYGKVILPFANEYEVNTDYSQICTGWKITKVGSNTSSSVTNYNFADRDNLQKDIYNESTNPFIYAQGGYYIVPTGVTSIEITANFAAAHYLSDATYEIGYTSSYDGRTELGGSVPSFHGKTVHNSLKNAVNALTINTTNPHKQAIVLVGNYHYDLAKGDLATGKGFTLMSIDADNNQEPDYGFYSIAPDRPQTPALRFDFVPIISLGMAAKVNGSYYYPGVPIWKPRGWYEQTETTVSIMNQFELDSGNFTNAENGNGQNPCIINGGYFAQIIRSNNGNCSKVSYFKIGGNAYIKEFYPGSHSNQTRSTTIVPVNVTGGQVDECFMTGYKSGAKAIGSDIRFWCSGGKIKKFLGAYMDKPMQTSTSTDENPGTVNMTARVDHALIGRFFGGGTSQNAAITGDIKVTINNSKVDFYCGGPEFGDMSSGKVVETTANNTKFGEYYGAGFGGTSITYSPKDGTPAIGANVTFSGYTFNTSRLTDPESLGLATCYKFEYLMHSTNKTQLVARFITGYANFSLATTGNVTNTLTGCTIEKDFYGAGCQGKVDGTVTSSLTGCTVKRNAFGGGYKAENNTVEVYPAAAPVPLSTYNGVTGIFSDFGTTTPETFTWKDGSSDPDDTGKKLYTGMTEDEMKELGNVTGAISLTIDGGYVGGTSSGQTSAESATATTPAIPAGGNVYGGGNESKSLDSTTVTLKGDAVIYGDVFGGGNKAEVQGSTTVNIED